MSFQLALLRNRFGRSTVNFPDWQEFEESILKDPEVVSLYPSKPYQVLSSAGFSFMRKLGKVFGRPGPYELPLRSPYTIRVAILGGTAFRRCPDFIRKGCKVAYLFDPAPPWVSCEGIAEFVAHTGIKLLFVPHPVFRDRLKPILKDCEVFYVPEAVDPEGYQWSQSKPIDLLSFGRKLKPYHNDLVSRLPESVNYQYGYIEDRSGLIAALRDAKIILNFPRSMTEPNQLAENDLDVEMVTMRYFQSIASKALLLGKCPPLLEELFGYNPMITADLENPVDQILDLLKNYDDYQPLIERNYEQLVSRHTYFQRWQEMKAIIQKVVAKPLAV
ncbi:MAG: glycosyltransferase [Verrucomicrobiae bacterium]|nr:glycosyltransferase [Verrucomicrobiae bacterium]